MRVSPAPAIPPTHRKEDGTVSAPEFVRADLAEAAMARYGYGTESIQIVRSMILDTAVHMRDGVLRQESSFWVSGYLLDADLSNFGRDDFWEKQGLVMRDLGVADERQFIEESLAFMEAHSWHTKAATLLREEKKQENIASLKLKLG